MSVDQEKASNSLTKAEEEAKANLNSEDDRYSDLTEEQVAWFREREKYSDEVVLKAAMERLKRAAGPESRGWFDGSSWEDAFVKFSDLKDYRGNPIIERPRKYYIHEANHPWGSRRMDDEHGDDKKIVFNPKWHNGRHFEFRKKYPNTQRPVELYCPGKGRYLNGYHMGGNVFNPEAVADVILGGGPGACYFRDAGKDDFGHQQYEMWSMTYDSQSIAFPHPDFGQDVIFLDVGCERAAFDKDWEVRLEAKTGELKVKFVPNEALD